MRPTKRCSQFFHPPQLSLVRAGSSTVNANCSTTAGLLFLRIADSRGEPMTGAGDNLIESTARALLRVRIEATPWFRIKMSQEQRRIAIEREVDTYWHLFVADAAERLLGPDEASQHPRH